MGKNAPMGPTPVQKVFTGPTGSHGMVPGFLGGTVAEWATLLALVLGPGLVATVLWSPVLASGRLRILFRSLPLTGSAAVSYIAVAMALSVPWVVGLGWALAEFGARVDNGPATGEPVLSAGVQLGLLYLVALPVAAGTGLPRLGIDWDPAGYDGTTWFVLVVASAWYAAIFALPTFLFGLIVSLPT